MSVASRNPFALLNDDDEPNTSPAPAAAKVAPAPAAAKPAAAKDQKPRGPATRGGRYYQRGGAKNVAKDAPEGADGEPTPRENRKTEGETRGRGRGGRGGRGRGAGGRGRQFDRHSGTLPDTEKRVNQGWGANEGTAELTAETQANADAARETTGDVATAAAADDWGVPAPAEGAADANGAPAERRKAAEEEDNSLTFDEYLAQKKESTIVPKIEAVRRANEGADESQWKDVVPLSKDKEEENYFIGKTKAAPKPRAKKEEKVTIEIEARFERPSRGGRGGRGGDRPPRGGDRPARGGNRGGNRGGQRNAPAQPDVNVADQTAFPSLA